MNILKVKTSNVKNDINKGFNIDAWIEIPSFLRMLAG